MKILLTSPRRSLYTGEWIAAPIQGLLSIASTIRGGTFFDTSHAEIRVVDEQLELIKNPNSLQGINNLDFNPDIIGVQALTSNLNNGIKMVRLFRARYPNALILMGGLSPTQRAEELLLKGIIDVVIHGEGEITFSELVYLYEIEGKKCFSKIKGLSYINVDGKFTKNSPRPNIRNLNILPSPARDLVDMELYKKISYGRSGNIVSSRGCSFVCKYCYSKHQWGVGLRRISVETLISQIREMYEVYGLERIRFEDDDFMENPKYVVEFCNAMIASGLNTKVEWEAKGRPNFMKFENLKLLRKANCFRLMMGVETLDPILLKKMNRGVTAERIERSLNIMNQADIAVQSTVVLGIPGESIESIRYTMEWLDKRLKGRDIMGPCFFTPWDGVEKDMKESTEFEIVIKDLDFYTGHMPVTSSSACNYDDLMKLYHDMGRSREGIFNRIAHLTPLEKVNSRIVAT